MKIPGMQTLASKFVDRKNSSAGHLIRDGIATLGIKVAYVLLQLGTNIFLARVLAPSGYGSVSLILSVVSVLGIIGNLGFPGFLVRAVAIYEDRREFQSLRQLLRTSVVSVATASILVAIVAFLVVCFSEAVEGTSSVAAFLLGLCLLPVQSLAETIGGALRGFGHPVAGQIPGELVKPAVLLVGVMIMNSWLSPVSPTQVLLANLGASVLALGTSVWLLVTRSPVHSFSSLVPSRTWGWIKGALPFTLLAGTQVMNHHVDVLMLGAMTGPEEVGLYRVATQIAHGLEMVLLAITIVITPQLARLHSNGDLQGAQRLLVLSHRFAVGLLIPPVVVLVLMGKVLLEIVFGPAYTRAMDALSVLSLGKIVYASVGFSGAALSMFGFASRVALANGLVLIGNVALNYLLIPTMGTPGAAAATTISQLLVNLSLAFRLKYALGAGATAFSGHLSPEGLDD